MGCSSLLCCLFADSQESRFQASKRSNMGSAVLEGCCSADIHEFCFQAAKCSDMFYVEMQWGYLMIVINCIIAAKSSDKSSTILQESRFPHAQE